MPSAKGEHETCLLYLTGCDALKLISMTVCTVTILSHRFVKVNSVGGLTFELN
jgi:hypothetical protein